ncbi:MAG: Holliday junction resolvase RuvX [Lentisphaerae bacterium]|nr:Holliday junction resolvase RuvX [Lentisphaerota bacterium]
MPRILGLDPGTKRVGVALSDPTLLIASPHTVLEAEPRSRLAAALKALCREKEVDRIVVGLPLRMDGDEGPAAEKARAFAAWAGEALGLPVEFWDERLSTVTAQNALIEGGARREKRREVVDMIAAQIVLQHYLDSRRPPEPFAFGDEDPR